MAKLSFAPASPKVRSQLESGNNSVSGRTVKTRLIEPAEVERTKEDEEICWKTHHTPVFYWFDNELH